MTIASSFEADGQFKVTDLTEQINLVTPKWTLLGDLGIYTTRGVTQDNVTFEVVEDSIQLITDTRRGSRNLVNRDNVRSLKSFPIPHFTLDDAVYASELAGKRAYGKVDAADSEVEAVARKLASIADKWAATHEIARVKTIVNGTAYAPNGTISLDFYSAFNISPRKTVAYALGTDSTNVIAKVEETIAHIQDNIQVAGSFSDIVVICSPSFFNALVSHKKVEEAYKFYSSTQEPLRQRLGANGLDGRYRSFIYAGATFIEYRGKYAGTDIIPSGEAYAFPRGVEGMFEMLFAPAQTLDLVNTIGEPIYAWQTPSARREFISLQTESNFLAACYRPNAIVKLTTT